MPRPAPSGTAAQQRIDSFKGFLAVETKRLAARHRFGLGGREIAQARSHLVDAVVAQACRMVAEDLGPSARGDLAASAVVALGGYGRQELSPASDVDLLFLHPGRLSRVEEDFVGRVSPVLWDIGLKLGHSVRSVEECLELAVADLHVRNAASEARLLLGSHELFGELQTGLLAKVFRNPRSNRRFFRAMRAEFLERRERYGPVIGMLEPHVKEGAGGLRDLHTVGWVGLARYGLRGLDDLLAGGLISRTDYACMLRAYDFLLRVRNESHFRTGRAWDVLTLEMQPALAAGLGYSDRGSAAASEIFMRDFYFRAQDVQRFTDAFLRQAEFTTPAAGLLPLKRRARAVGPGRRYRIRGEYLLPGQMGLGFEGDALRLFEVFSVAQQHGVCVGAELKEAVHDNLDLVDREVRHSPEAAAAFLALLGPLGRVATTLAEMHETGFLGRYLPEFRNLTFMVQHDYYHRYTVDQHTLRAIQALDDLAAEGPNGGGEIHQLRAALDDIEDPTRLVLALLLHDVGKGQGGGHVTKGARLAADVGRRLGIDAEAREDIVFLVSKHLVMSRVSQRRDLTDQALLRGFAETTGTVDRLNMLYVLTFADMSGVGPGVWNEWKAVLLGDLHSRTRALLTEGEQAEEGPHMRVRLEERVLDDLLPEFLRSDVDEFLTHLPDRYMLSVSSEAIARHFEMIRTLGSRPFLTEWRQSKKGPYTLLSVCMRDKPGVLASIAGALTGSGLDILSVEIFTRDDGIVLDWFKVCEAMGSSSVQPVPEERFEAIDADLGAALEGTLDLASAVDRQRARQIRRRRRRRRATAPVVRFEDAADPDGGTVIEVRADDEPGLVYRIAATLAQLGMNISLAKIATEKNQALDVFYVSNAESSSLSPGEQAAVERALVEALTHEPRQT